MHGVIIPQAWAEVTDDPRTRPDNPAWYGLPPIPLDPALHATLWFHSQSEAERKRIIAEQEHQREQTERWRLEAARRTETARLKAEKAR